MLIRLDGSRPASLLDHRRRVLSVLDSEEDLDCCWCNLDEVPTKCYCRLFVDLAVTSAGSLGACTRRLLCQREGSDRRSSQRAGPCCRTSACSRCTFPVRSRARRVQVEVVRQRQRRRWTRRGRPAPGCCLSTAAEQPSYSENVPTTRKLLIRLLAAVLFWVQLCTS